MTIDERLDRLVERHEALVATIELDHREFRETFALTTKAIADLVILSQSHEKRLDDFTGAVDVMRQNFDARLKRLEGPQ